MNSGTRIPLASLALALALSAADVSTCTCDPSRPETLEAHACSLCGEAEKQPADAPYFFLKDKSPYKPSRWLILARDHRYDGARPFSRMSAVQRKAFWTAAIGRARSMWGDKWGLALNGDEVRTQCHAHVHMGRLLEGVEYGRPLVVASPAGIPVSKDGSGMWIHAHGNKLHVHLGEQRAETVLLR